MLLLLGLLILRARGIVEIGGWESKPMDERGIYQSINFLSRGGSDSPSITAWTDWMREDQLGRDRSLPRLCPYYGIIVKGERVVVYKTG